MLLTILSLLATILIILMIERFAQPRSGHRPLLHKVSLLAMMPVIVFFLTAFMITYRPLLSMAATVIAFSIIVVINNAKFRVLKEPLVYSDFSLLREAVRHPALYVRYIGSGKLIVCTIAAVAAITAGITQERPVVHRFDLDDYFPTIIYLAIVIGLIYAITRGPLRRPLIEFLKQFGATADLAADMDKLSLVACLVVYFFLARPVPSKNKSTKSKDRVTATALTDAPDGLPLTPLLKFSELNRPDILVIQSESFFDVRRLNENIPRDLLSHLDEISKEASFYGRLTVPAWGANTMRTEFEFLSGIPNESLGYDKFNPYRSLTRRPAWTIAHTLRAIGYRATCIHPFESTFFDRDTVFPNLGFDEFIDIKAFSGAERFGPYVSDQAVTDKVEHVLTQNKPPNFIFVITMENHGKWESGRLQNTLPEAAKDTPLELYLRHIKNTNRVIHRLHNFLKGRDRDSVFCLYGDHIPSFPKEFDESSYRDARTDYFIWRRGAAPGRRFDTTADVLHRLIVNAALTPN